MKNQILLLCIAVAIGLFHSMLGTQAFAQRVTTDKIADLKASRYLKKAMEDHHIPGASLLVLRHGKIISSQNYGKANLENSVAVTSRSAFQICSITKPFTAIAVMLLVEDGKISIDDAIINYLPTLSKAGENVTIRHLLSHTSGIRDYDERPSSEVDKCSEYTLPDLEKWFKSFYLITQPGEKWSYENTDYNILGRLIEKVSGRTYGEFLQERIFGPLKMSDTKMLSYDEVTDRRVQGYIYQSGKFMNGGNIKPELEFASGGLVSTVLDLAKLDAALFTESLLKRASLNEMWTNARLNDGSIVKSYGLGFGLSDYKGKKRVGHNGGCPPGFSTALQRFSEGGISVILLTNAEQKAGFIGDLSNEIAYFYLK
ncbi:MAG: serine hydrolase domain-containing protein [Acidobacteriota bacterium]